MAEIVTHAPALLALIRPCPWRPHGDPDRLDGLGWRWHRGVALLTDADVCCGDHWLLTRPGPPGQVILLDRSRSVWDRAAN